MSIQEKKRIRILEILSAAIWIGMIWTAIVFILIYGG